MSKSKQMLGVKGEKLALQFLRRKGYKIITRNFSCRFGEIDIIARQNNATVFIEVKTRGSCQFGLPQESINSKKKGHLFRCAQFYIKDYAHPNEEFRFDVVSIILEDKPVISLIKDAL